MTHDDTTLRIPPTHVYIGADSTRYNGIEQYDGCILLTGDDERYSNRWTELEKLRQRQDPRTSIPASIIITHTGEHIVYTAHVKKIGIR